MVNFVYTGCTTVCPVTSSIFSMLQQHLGERMGKEVALVTITVDPSRETPHRLLNYSQNSNPGAAWNWLTGDKGSVDQALHAFGAYTPNFEDHPAMLKIGLYVENFEARKPMLPIGNTCTGHWQKITPNLPPQVIATKLKEMADGV